MKLPEIHLNDPIYCNGCPCSAELFFQAFCMLYNVKIKLDEETSDTKSFMKRLRLDKCREENGI